MSDSEPNTTKCGETTLVIQTKKGRIVTFTRCGSPRCWYCGPPRWKVFLKEASAHLGAAGRTWHTMFEVEPERRRAEIKKHANSAMRRAGRRVEYLGVVVDDYVYLWLDADPSNRNLWAVDQFGAAEELACIVDHGFDRRFYSSGWPLTDARRPEPTGTLVAKMHTAIVPDLIHTAHEIAGTDSGWTGEPGEAGFPAAWSDDELRSFIETERPKAWNRLIRGKKSLSF